MKLKVTRNKSSRKLWFNLGKRQLFIALYKKPAILTTGMTNETEDRMYVPFIDYDNINEDKLLKEARMLIDKWNLSGLVQIVTKELLTQDGDIYGNYHLVGFDKLRYHEHIELLRDTCCDENFLNVPRFFRYKHWVLRIKPKVDDRTWKVVKGKPYIKSFIRGLKHCPFEQSYAHYQFMRKYYGLKPIVLNWDGSMKLQIIRYSTTSG